MVPSCIVALMVPKEELINHVLMAKIILVIRSYAYVPKVAGYDLA
jgi:hypothetical protein